MSENGNLSGVVPSTVFIDEAQRIVQDGQQQGITMRVMGAVAYRIHSGSFADLHRKLGRVGKQEFTDIDLMSYNEFERSVPDLFRSWQYKPWRGSWEGGASLTFHVYKRHIFVEPKGRFKVEIFFDRLEMSHVIDFRNRLEADFPTIPLAELMLEKLQIVQITEKDLKDCIVTIRAHEIGEQDGDRINGVRIGRALFDDWGLWYTSTQNLQKIVKFARTLDSLSDQDRNDLEAKVTLLRQHIDRTTKSVKWKMRAKIGSRRKWYNDVSEGSDEM
jgi:hypothetical protein